MLEELLDRFSGFALAGPVEWGRSNKHTSIRHLPVVLTPSLSRTAAQRDHEACAATTHRPRRRSARWLRADPELPRLTAAECMAGSIGQSDRVEHGRHATC